MVSSSTLRPPFFPLTVQWNSGVFFFIRERMGWCETLLRATEEKFITKVKTDAHTNTHAAAEADTSTSDPSCLHTSAQVSPKGLY